MTTLSRPAARRLAALLAAALPLVLPAGALADGAGCTNTTGLGGGFGRLVTANTFTFNASSPNVPKATTDGSTVTSTITSTANGKLRALKLTIGSLSHPLTSDLKLVLQTPDNTQLVLANGRGTGANFQNTVFTSAGTSILASGANSPFTGTFAPEQDIADILGKEIQGAWKLFITDKSGNGVGTLDSWSLELTRQPCGSAAALASFTATPAQVVPGGTVSFDASASVGTGSAAISSYQWDLDGDGTYETNTGTTKTVPNITFNGPKRVVAVGLKITDSSGGTDETVVPLPVTEPPVADFSFPGAIQSFIAVPLDASASTDSDGNIVRYQWDLDGNGSFEKDAGSAAIYNATFLTSGTRNVGLKVTDDTGATAIVRKNVTVANRAPVAAFDVVNAPAVVGAQTTLDGAASSDQDGNIVRYQWDMNNDNTFEVDTQGTPKVTYTFANSGTYFVGLKVTDNAGTSTTIVRSVVATKAPVAQASASVTTIRPGGAVTFDPAGSADQDLDGTIATYAWDFDGDGTVDRTTTGPIPVTYTYPALGTYDARLIVTDDQGAQGVKVIRISVINKVPVAVMSIGPNPAQTGQNVTFNAAGSLDPDGTIVRYQWDLDGNGTYEMDTSGTPSATRRYPNSLRLTVRVRVTDNDGATATGAATLAVNGTSTSTTPPPTGGGTGGGGTGGGTTQTFRASLLGAPIQKMRTALKRGVGVTCQVDRRATCAVEIVVLPRDAKKLKLAKRPKKPVRVAKGTVSTTRSGKKTLTMKLSRKAKKALKRGKRVVLVVRGTATASTGAKVSLKRAVMLR